MPALTGLRAVAAAMVFFYHWLFEAPNDWPLFPRALINQAHFWVVIFFVLSGFLITVRYADALSSGRTTTGPYLLKRLLRIFPLYWVIFTLFVVLPGRPIGFAPDTPWRYFVGYSLTQAFFPSLYLSGSQTAWTLTLELLFYALAPALLIALFRQRLSKVIAVLTVVVCASLGIALILARVAPLWPDTWFGAPQEYLLQFSIFGRLPDFIAGMAAGFVFLRLKTREPLYRAAPFLIVAGLLLLVLEMVASEALKLEVGSIPHRVVELGVAVGSGLLIFGLAGDKDKRSLISRALGAPLIEYLGKISYALYLIQLTEPVQWIYWVGIGETISPLRLPRTIVLYGITSLIAVGLYHLVEQPAQRLLSKALRLHGA